MKLKTLNWTIIIILLFCVHCQYYSVAMKGLKEHTCLLPVASVASKSPKSTQHWHTWLCSPLAPIRQLHQIIKRQFENASNSRQIIIGKSFLPKNYMLWNRFLNHWLLNAHLWRTQSGVRDEICGQWLLVLFYHLTIVTVEVKVRVKGKPTVGTSCTL